MSRLRRRSTIRTSACLRLGETADGLPFIAMEFVEGKSLTRR